MMLTRNEQKQIKNSNRRNHRVGLKGSNVVSHVKEKEIHTHRPQQQQYSGIIVNSLETEQP